MSAFYLSILGAIGQPSTGGEGSACADAIQIQASDGEIRQLRAHLRKGALAQPLEDCHEYQVEVTRVGANRWLIALRRSSSHQLVERSVNKLSYAATWIETWLLSGFAASKDVQTTDSTAPVDAPATKPAPINTPPGAASAVRPPQPIVRSKPEPNSPPSGLFLSLGPAFTETNRDHRLLGATLTWGLPARHSPWFGVELGGAAELGAAGHERIRAYWAGPLVGLTLPFTESIRLRPALTLGVVLATTSNSHTARLYSGIGGAVEYDLTKNISLGIGLDARLLFARLLGSSGTKVIQSRGSDETEADDSEDDDLEDDDKPTTTTTPLPMPDLGILSCTASLGVVWRFGGPS